MKNTWKSLGESPWELTFNWGTWNPKNFEEFSRGIWENLQRVLWVLESEIGLKIVKIFTIPIYKGSGICLSCPFSNMEIFEKICSWREQVGDTDLFCRSLFLHEVLPCLCLGKSLCHFYTKMDPLRYAEKSHTLLEIAKTCKKWFFNMVYVKIKGDLFPTHAFWTRIQTRIFHKTYKNCVIRGF